MKWLLILLASLIVLPLILTIAVKIISSVRLRRSRCFYTQCIPLVDAYLQGADFLEAELAHLDLTAVAEVIAKRASHSGEDDVRRLQDLFVRLGCLDETLGALKGSCKVEKLRALSRLGDVRIADATDAVAAALNDPDEDVVREAIASLGNIGTFDATRAIVEYLTRADNADTAAVAQALLVASEGARAYVRDYLSGAGKKKPLLEVLGAVKGDWALADVQHLAMTGDCVTRRAAVAALGAIGDKGAVTVLEELLGDPAWEVREEAAVSLGRLRSHTSCYLLAHALADNELQVRTSAGRVLASLGRVGERTLVKTLFSDEATARRAAAEAFERSGALDKYLRWIIDGDEHQKQEASLIVEALIDAGVTGWLDDYFGVYAKGTLKELITANLKHRSGKKRAPGAAVVSLGRTGEGCDTYDAADEDTHSAC